MEDEVSEANSLNAVNAGLPYQNPASKIGKVFVIDHHFALDQIDIIENCDILSNLVVPDTVLKHLFKKNVQTFHGLRNTLEQSRRQMYYHYNENFSDTFVDDRDERLKNKGLDYKLKFKVSKVFEFYFKHF